MAVSDASPVQRTDRALFSARDFVVAEGPASKGVVRECDPGRRVDMAVDDVKETRATMAILACGRCMVRTRASLVQLHRSDP